MGNRLLHATLQRFSSLVPRQTIRDDPPSLQTDNWTKRNQFRERLEPRILAGQGLSATSVSGSGASIQTATTTLFLRSRPQNGLGIPLHRGGRNLRPQVRTLRNAPGTTRPRRWPNPREPVASDKKSAKTALRVMGPIKRSVQLI